jgi:hypothetical protein
LIEVVQGVQKKLNKSASKGEKKRKTGGGRGRGRGGGRGRKGSHRLQITNARKKISDPSMPVVKHLLGIFSFFLHFSFLFFGKIYGLQKKNCKTIHLTPEGRRQGPTDVPRGGRGPVFSRKFVIFLNLDGGKLYMKIVAFDEIYNFVVQNFSI